jgi:hypothetical protein
LCFAHYNYLSFAKYAQFQLARFRARDGVDLQMDASLRRKIAPRDQCGSITITRTKTRAKNASGGPFSVLAAQSDV